MQDLKIFFPHSVKKKKKFRSVLVPSGFWQQISVAWCFGSKSLPSKRISQIKLDRNKIKKKKKTRSGRVEEDEERKKKKRKKLKRMTEQRDLPRRGQSRAQSWEAWG